MSAKQQGFKYQDRVLIEKMVIQPPYRHERVFQDEGCFLYVKEVGVRLLSSKDNLLVEGREAVLLKCDTYFMDIVKRTDEREVEVIAVHLYPEILKKLYIHELPGLIKGHQGNAPTKHIADHEIIARFIESLEFYFQHPSLVNDDLLELKIKELILLLMQTKNIGSIMELISDLYSPRASSLKEVVGLHLYSNLTTAELAKLSGMSLSSFKREFKKQFNDSPASYINGEKLKKAKSLLMVSDLAVSDIAYEVGFNDPLYFTRIFTKHEGVPPSTFRSNHLA
ncbi:helix-turn-helix transcriptional regulator [Neolewinella aurantiaca]|uniref:Helix-turn-helix transcriptional regulator n=1 Tax=Neolewinella aurantiaca TaxID=2602767 RepID=A0A5C7FND9_9BACT|nr:helix-turn-helix transcriptional regulator [Neolewinella aurantiaca]TXF89042.1 helix-turn-helix transcriptional regulator [Neolewinella aurantiaca]